METMGDASALISGILRITHPELFHTACKVMEEIKNTHKCSDIIDQWGTPFNALSIVVNRSCPPHRDTKSRTPYYDILASFGDFSSVRINLKTFGMTAILRPGGMVVMSGHVVLHEAEECDGDRVCYAWYMRGSVHSQMEGPPTSWMAQEVYREFVESPEFWFRRKYHTQIF